jgi:predicted protein tyrosine phosphatase
MSKKKLKKKLKALLKAARISCNDCGHIDYEGDDFTGKSICNHDTCPLHKYIFKKKKPKGLEVD